MATRRRRKGMHPLFREIRKREREIEKLKAAARMLGLDLGELEPVVLSPAMRRAKRMTRKQVMQQLREAYTP